MVEEGGSTNYESVEARARGYLAVLGSLDSCGGLTQRFDRLQRRIFLTNSEPLYGETVTNFSRVTPNILVPLSFVRSLVPLRTE